MRLGHSTRAALLGIASLCLSACSPQLPGPLDCEGMAIKGMGRSLKEIKGSPLSRNIMGLLTHSCLTTPFDFEAVRCVEDGRGLRRCADELALREPERTPALRRMLASIMRLDQKGRALR